MKRARFAAGGNFVNRPLRRIRIGGNRKINAVKTVFIPSRFIKLFNHGHKTGLFHFERRQFSHNLTVQLQCGSLAAGAQFVGASDVIQSGLLFGTAKAANTLFSPVQWSSNDV